jgi:hypothetical protein
MLKNFAYDLKNIRESKGITLNDIYFLTKIHHSNFEKIESGDFNFQPQTYIRAFLRQYARVLNLDDEEVLRNYDLAKMGKYHPKSIYPEESKQDITNSPVPEVLVEKTNAPEKISERDKFDNKKLVQVNDKKDESNSNYVVPKSSFYEKDNENILPKIFKVAGSVILVALVVIGIYLIVKYMFLEKTTGNKNEIVRQSNFDDVVKEQEKKMLGKRTPEEIQDSITLAQHIRDSVTLALKDTNYITLIVEAKKKGEIIVISDTSKSKRGNKDTFKRMEYLDYKARNYFLISSNDISAFDIKLDGKKVNFEEKVLKDFKISKKTAEK